jgi:hypothetical protein
LCKQIMRCKKQRPPLGSVDHTDRPKRPSSQAH